jgi:hypothetical protein
MRERGQLGAEDEPMTREVQHFVSEELRRSLTNFGRG